MPIINVNLQNKAKTLTVSELNRQSRQLLEKQFQQIKVEGELTNLAKPHSGHLYFRLKDQDCQVQCAFFKNKARKLNFELEEGTLVIATATVSLYEARGDYQLIVESLEPAGLGLLQKRFEELKAKLRAEGLFEPTIKKAIPFLPQKIAIITSPTGAAIHDILTTLKRRFPAIPLALYPTQVQGNTAALDIARQISLANEHNQCDVIILARGGGSLEDLWAFNEEVVAYAIYHSKIPIISGVGHETDTTLADFCADYRAATPTAAAEKATPLSDEIIALLQNQSSYLNKLIYDLFSQRKQCLDLLQAKLQSPKTKLNQLSLHTDALTAKLFQQIRLSLFSASKNFKLLHEKLLSLNVKTNIHQQNFKLNQLNHRITTAVNNRFAQSQLKFKQLAATLHTISPLATLERGYSLSQDEQGNIISDIKQVSVNQTIAVRLNKGKLLCQIQEKKSC